jgi:hypothetical protein
MKRIKEFESLLFEKINTFESREPNEGVSINDFDRYLSGEGTVIYTYTSILLGCEIRATYRGWRYYGDQRNAIKLQLEISFE